VNAPVTKSGVRQVRSTCRLHISCGQSPVRQEAPLHAHTNRKKKKEKRKKKKEKRKKKKEKRNHIEQAMPVKAAIYQKCHPMPATSLPTRDR